MNDSHIKLKQTYLYDIHVQLGARMVDYAGWSMPINYQSQIIEHQAVRENAGMFDVSHMQVIDLRGKKTQAMVSYLIANNINKIKVGQAIYSAMLDHNAGIIDDLICYFIGPDHYRLVVNAGCTDKDLKWISQVAKDFNVKVTYPKNLSIIAIQGPNANSYLMNFLNQYNAALIKTVEELKPFYFFFSEELMIARTGYTGEAGVECILSFDLAKEFWQSMLDLGVRACGLASRDSLRLEAGFPLYGHELDDSHHPLESGLGWCTSLDTNRDFIGKKTLLDIKKAGVKNKLVGILLKDKGMIRENQSIITSKGEGKVTSGGYSPTLKQSIGLARVPIGSDENCLIKIRDKQLNARITSPAFVRNGKALIHLN